MDLKNFASLVTYEIKGSAKTPRFTICRVTPVRECFLLKIYFSFFLLQHVRRISESVVTVISLGPLAWLGVPQ